jgi:branched-chain amino acid transport system substrate-binding protein
VRFAMRRIIGSSLALALGLGLALAAAPSAITIGTLYASSGPFASSSLPEYQGLKFWVQQVDQSGGVYVEAFHKKLPVKLVAYDDQSSTTLATTLYEQLITQDHVNLLVSDFGSVLTSVAVPIAKEHKVLLLDVTGTGASFFTPSNPYIVLTSLPTSGVWPESLASFLIHKKIQRVAIVYDANDFDASQNQTLVSRLTAAGIHPLYDQSVPTSTSSYTALLHSIAARNPEALIEFGYPNNDIAFLQALENSGLHFNMVFTIFPGQLYDLLLKNVGVNGLRYTYTYPTPPLLQYNRQVNYGPTIQEFTKMFQKATGSAPNFLNVAGYNAGLIIQKILATAPSLSQLALRKAAQEISGKIFTLDGLFKINAEGAQIGESLPVAQLQPSGQGLKVVKVWPEPAGMAIYPAP